MVIESETIERWQNPETETIETASIDRQNDKTVDLFFMMMDLIWNKTNVKEWKSTGNWQTWDREGE